MIPEALPCDKTVLFNRSFKNISSCMSAQAALEGENALACGKQLVLYY